MSSAQLREARIVLHIDRELIVAIGLGNTFRRELNAGAGDVGLLDGHFEMFGDADFAVAIELMIDSAASRQEDGTRVSREMNDTNFWTELGGQVSKLGRRNMVRIE